MADDTALLLNDDVDAIDGAPTTGQQRRRRRQSRLFVLLVTLSLAFLTLLGPLVAVYLGELHRRETLEAPCPRKGGVALVLGGGGGGRGGGGGGGRGGGREGGGGGRGGGDNSGSNGGDGGGKEKNSSSSFSPPRLVVWSGKKRGRLSGDADGELHGAVHVLDLGGKGKRKKKWKVVKPSTSTSRPSSLSSPASSSSSSALLPLPRWKPVAAPLSPSVGALFGGDAQIVEDDDEEEAGANKGVEDSYLNDFWKLELLPSEEGGGGGKGDSPSVRWTRVGSDEPFPSFSEAVAVPQARRAALGVSLLPEEGEEGEEEEEEKESGSGVVGGEELTKKKKKNDHRRRSLTLLVHGGRGRHKREGILNDLWAATEEGSEGEGRGGRGERAEWERLWPSPRSGPLLSSSSSEAPLPRKGHAGVALPRGGSLPLFPGPALFLTGGRNDSSGECYHGDTFLFDIDGGKKWHRLPFASSSSSSSSPSSSSVSSSVLRRDHAGVWLCDKQQTVFVFGGRGGASHEESGPLGDLLAFDLRSKSWSVAVSSPSPSSSFSSSFLPSFFSSSPSPAPRFLFGVGTYRSPEDGGDTKAVVFGGEGGRGVYFNDAWEFSCRERKWRALTRGAAAAAAG